MADGRDNGAVVMGADAVEALMVNARAMLEEVRGGQMAMLNELRKQRGEQSGTLEQFYMYGQEGELPFTQLAATVGAPGTLSFRISQSSDFYATAITAVAVDDANPLTDGFPFTYQIIEQSGDLVMSNNFVHSTAGTGTGQRPMYLPRPRKFRANSEVRVDLRNQSATLINVFWYMTGWKVYYKDRMNLTARR